MSGTNDRPIRQPLTPLAASLADLVALTLAAGLAAGFLDRLSLALRAVVVEPIVFVGRHAWWTGPSATVLFFGIVLVGLAVVAALVRRVDRLWTAGVWAFGFLAAFGALYSFPQIQRVAALLLSAGVATVLARRIGEPTPARRRGVRRIGAVLCLSTIGVAAASLTRDALRERRLTPAAGTAAAAPNVLLLVLDTVRAINLSLYGYHRETTPELTRWAAKGVAFTRAYSTAPWTLPSHASMMTGRWMHELSTDWMVPLDRTDPTIAEVLGARGYRTGGFVANTDYCSAEVGLDRGFGHYEDYTLDLGQLLRSSSLWRAAARIEPIRRIIGNHDNLGRRTAPEISGAFLRWLDRDPTRPYFGFLNYYDAHRPYFPPGDWPNRFRTPGVELNPRYRKESGAADQKPSRADIQGAIDAYDNAIGYLDSEIGKLLDELERRGQLERTIVIITSDHGEEFHEHGLWDHGNTLYHSSVHVPLLVIAPGRVPAGATVSQPVSIRSLPATVVDLLQIPGQPPFPGTSLSGTWSGTSLPDSILVGVRQVPRQPPHYPVSKGNLGSVVTARHQYIRNQGDGTEELFDLDAAARPRMVPIDSVASASRFRALVDAMFPSRSP
ncbi:MAG: sulfatase [Gemmatimonadales bacterium]